ncbi:carbohydrate ABC transporter permease [Paenibacillus illinoisensis]|uniref:Binding-protein-dependent transport systems inner membrane component n=1 Tax=Paenibacillus illinoisensis TaxID=59845 RepID=A0A2W0CBE1_9BACL|nr:sugar ABC transporter permease [Paenibacillus illinoisensis]PYY25068.1 Binding-protein-dependent transport systems inner membrane component [Paenibacillus illinoisensis]
MGKALRPKGLVLVAYLLPGLLIYSFVVLVPILAAFRDSFYSWTGGPKKTYIGMGNYKEILQDDVFWHSFLNNVLMTAYGLIGQVGFGFVFALLLMSKMVKLKGLHRTMSYFPSTLAPVIIAFLWMLVYNYNYGLLNAGLTKLGLGALVQSWLDLTGPIVLLASIPLSWQNIGFFTLLMLAGLSTINKEVLEVAELDGATGVRKAWYIIIPLAKPTLVVASLLCIANNMRGFEHIYALTGGGPGNSSSVMALYAYETSFLRFRYGYGSALAIAIITLTMLMILLSTLLLQRRNHSKGGA